MEHPDTSDSWTLRRRLRLWLPAAMVLFLSLTLSATTLYLGARRTAQQEAVSWGETIARSAAILIQPLLLADDRISLNYIFSELGNQPLLHGLKLTNPQKLVVAVAGDELGIKQTLELARGNAVFGELTLWISPQPAWQLLSRQWLEAALMALASLLLTLATLWFSIRRQTRPETKTRPEEPRFEEVAASVSPLLANDWMPEDAPRGRNDSDVLPENLAEIQAEEEDEVSVSDEEYPLDFPDEADAEDPDAIPEFDDTPYPPLLTERDDAAYASEVSAPPSIEESAAPVSTNTQAEAEPDDDAHYSTADTNRDLVELLKPEKSEPRMPRFHPSERQPDESDEAIAPDIDQVELEDRAADTDTRRPDLSLVSGLNRREEEQLGLYTLEQELELMLPAGEAGYLFLIDATSAHADNIESQERDTLMRHYRTLANSVAHIYSGRVEPLSGGDLQLFFDSPSEDDSHGINALCAATLFVYLYKQYNQYRIRQFKPVMNLHMALVRGNHDNLQRLLDEARFLTRTTQSNELISHTALTEAADLKNTLLNEADIRREDEDKVLIVRVARSYQELLEKQARHLLTKLLSRDKEAEQSQE